MKVLWITGTALRALARHRLRSSLSALGVTCGVAALVAMLAVTEGARAELVAQIARLGTNTILLAARAAAAQGAEAAPAGGSLRARDVARLEAELPGLRHLAPVVEVPAAVPDAPVDRPPRLVGTTWQYFRISGLRAASGRTLAPSDDPRRALVCVLGAEAARDLGRLGRVGATLALGRVGVEVVGVLQPRGRPGSEQRVVASRDFDRTIFVPISACGAIDATVSPERPDEITVALDSAERVERAPEAIGRILGRERGGVADYDLVVPAELLAQAGRAQRVFGAVLGAVAAIALLMGGVGIMNVMLVSVSERAREIGLRRAVGASAAAVLVQFLVECLALTVSGALVGLGLGAAGAEVISEAVGWPTLISRWSVLWALAMAACVGLLSGVYPALKAARLDPIRALRSA